MGILDDAIREHLELKRSHGATDEEIRRQEAEVFGQAHAGSATATAVDDEHTELLSPEHAPDLEPLEPAPEDPYAVHPSESLQPDPDATQLYDIGEPAHPAEERHEPAPSPSRHDHHDHDDQHPALIDHDHIGGEEHPPEPVFGHGTTPPAEPVTEPHELEEPRPRQVHEEAHGEDEDVLEETPEFLQDAPEHDRLWFEQKPPRDFDFGE
jgi:hypothetical protein